MSSESYVKAAIKTVQLRLEEDYKQLTCIVKTPKMSGYRPELDVSEILGPDASNWFQNLIIILNLIVELGHADIDNLAERLSNFLTNPSAGNLRDDLQ